MPPIEVTRYEPDDNGGWYVEWHDPENLDGQPLTAFVHLTDVKAAEFVRLSRALKRPNDEPRKGLDRAFAALSEAKGKPREGPSVGPPQDVQDFMGFYSEHVRDCIDRVKLDVRGSAPHDVLEKARKGEAVAGKHRRSQEKAGLGEFMRKSPARGGPA